MSVVDEAQRESVAVTQVRERLAAESTHAASDVSAAVDHALRRFAGAPVRDFVPLLIERLARDDLRKRHRIQFVGIRTVSSLLMMRCDMQPNIYP